jgi:hypothetical protein
VALATLITGIKGVLVARIASGRFTMRSSSAKSADLTAGSSAAASTIRSRSARSARSVRQDKAAERDVTIVGREFPCLEAPLQRGLDPGAPGRGGRFVDLADDDV